MTEHDQVSRAALADLTQHVDARERAWCFAVSGACLSASRALSAALTGLMAETRWIGGEAYPFLTPFAAAAAPIFGAAAFTA
eukprot:2311413-Pleurochrysis_carterae.AAC.1